MSSNPAEHAASARPAQHRSVVAREAAVVDDASRPTPGPIAILPNEVDVFADAVRSAGGEVTGMSDAVKGVVWLSSEDPQRLVDLLHDNPGIEWVQLPWAGVDAYADALAPFATDPKPLWTSAKGAYSQPVAEHALALTLALLRVFPKRVVATSWSKEPEGRSLYGMSVLVVGAGGIAVELLRLLEPFDVDVTIVRRSADAVPGAKRTVTVDRLDEVLPDADVVVIAAALTGATTGLFARDQFCAMKSDAVLVNIARGGLVDTDALVDALESGDIAGAGLDVTDPEPLPDGHPLWTQPNALITPHSADTPDMTAPLLAGRIRENTQAFLGDGRFVGVVDPAAGY